jgi:acyl-CoA thioester hydrolase
MKSIKYPFEMELEVIFRDIDAMSHVNNAVFFTYFETARIKYFSQILEGSGLVEQGAYEMIDLPLILVEAYCSYKSPALLGEKLRLGAGLSRFGTKSFDLVYRVEGEDGRLIAEGKTVQVMYDYVASQAFPIPDQIKAFVKDYQNDWTPPETAQGGKQYGAA